MTSTVIIKVNSVVQDGFPAGTTVSALQVKLVGSNGNPQPDPVIAALPDGVSTATFSDVPDDIYSISVQSLDGNGVPLGNPLTGQATVPAPDPAPAPTPAPTPGPTVSLPVPGSFSVSIQSS